jgi:hypothetical protein
VRVNDPLPLLIRFEDRGTRTKDRPLSLPLPAVRCEGDESFRRKSLTVTGQGFLFFGKRFRRNVCFIPGKLQTDYSSQASCCFFNIFREILEFLHLTDFDDLVVSCRATGGPLDSLLF